MWMLDIKNWKLEEKKSEIKIKKKSTIVVAQKVFVVKK